MKISDIEPLELIHTISKHYGIDIELVNYGEINSSGKVFCDLNLIKIDKDITSTIKLKDKKILLSILIHEVCHILCYRKGIYKNYHNMCVSTIKCMNDYTTEQLKTYYLIAFKAERYVDRMATNEIKKWNDNVKYYGYYYTDRAKKRSIEERKFLKDYIKTRE